MENKPHIMVFCSNKIKKSEIEEILWGIEEEGLPYFLKFVPDIEVKKKNYTQGILEVGIGINSNKEVMLNSKKYDKEYILKHSLDQSDEKLRALGNNSARLVKGLALKLSS